MKVLLFRHGSVALSGEKMLLGRTNLPLSAEGRRQAEAWRHCLRERLPDRIVSSPLSRALEFVRIIAGDRAEEVTVCRELSEINLGDWEGRPVRDIRKTEPAAWQARWENLAEFRPMGGESFTDVQKRAVPAFEKLTHIGASDLMIVSHAGVNRAILCRLLGAPLNHLFRIGQDYACLNIVECGHWGARVKSINVPCPGTVDGTLNFF